MQVNSIVSSKGGVGKTTTSANLGGIAADAGLKTLLIDLDGQPTLSSYFPLEYQAPGGTFDLLVHSNTTPEKIISRTNIPGLDIILSNDPHNQLETLLLHAPDGRLRLRSLLKRLPAYDLVIIDTKGTSAVTVEMALVASDLALSPLVPEMLSAREFSRGTLALFASVDRLRQSAGFGAPPLYVVFNRQDNTNDARIISANIRELMGELVTPFHVLDAAIPALLTYRLAASEGIPAHRLEPRVVADRGHLRRLISIGHDQIRIASQPSANAQEAHEQCEQALFALGQRSSKVEFRPFADVLSKVIDQIDHNFNSGEALTGLPSDLPDLDEVTAGFQPSDLIIVAGRPSMGKTALALNWVAPALRARPQHSVQIYSLEMPADKLVYRLLAGMGRIDLGRLLKGQLEDEDWSKLSTAVAKLQQFTDRLMIDDSHELCPFVQRVAILLHEKQVPFQRIDVDLKVRPDWFLAMSPTGKVPLLKVQKGDEGAKVLFESVAICEFIEEVYPEPALHPEDAITRAQHRAWIEFATAMLADAWGYLNAADQQTALSKSAALRGKLERFELEKSDGDYFAGAKLSMVDISASVSWWLCMGHLRVRRVA